MSVNLYDLTTDALKLEAMLDEGGPEHSVDEALAEALAEALEGNQEAINEKVGGYVRLLRNWEATAAMIKAEEKRLADRRQVFDNKGKRLRARLLSQLQRMDSPTLKLDVATVGRSKGRETVQIDDDLVLPQGYFSTSSVVTPDKKALKQLWTDTPEAERTELLGFHVERGAESLTIK